MMARPPKAGLDYFSHDVDMSSDQKIELLEAKQGLVGYAIYNKLLERIYRDGYCLPWDENTALILSRRVNVDINTMSDVIKSLFDSGLFNKKLFDKYGVLTSCGIQKRYLKGCARRKKVFLASELLLIDVNEYKNDSLEVVIVDINYASTGISVYKSTQRKGKEKKEEENKYKREKIPESPPDDFPPGVTSLTSDQADSQTPTDKKNLSVEFEEWWKTYPKRRGRKVGKQATKALFKKIKPELLSDLQTATMHYTWECDGLPKDPERFLRNDFWKDFVRSAEPTKTSVKNSDEMSFIEIQAEMERKRKEKEKSIIDIN